MMKKLINPFFLSCVGLLQLAAMTIMKNYHEIRPERSAISISITNGSGNISLKIEDEHILN